jgi:hypothetical protein
VGGDKEMKFEQDWKRIEGLAYGKITEQDAKRLGPIMADNAHEIVRLVNIAQNHTKLLAVVNAATNLLVFARPPKSDWLDDLDNALDVLEEVP